MMYRVKCYFIILAYGYKYKKFSFCWHYTALLLQAKLLFGILLCTFDNLILV